MRRFFSAVLLLSLTFAATAGSTALAATYVGHTHDLWVKFRTRGPKIVEADVFARLYCRRANGDRHLDRVRRDYASARYPLALDKKGRFRVRTPEGTQEEGHEEVEDLSARVGPRSVIGTFEYEFSFTIPRRGVVCQTGSFPLAGRDTDLSFRARRR